MRRSRLLLCATIFPSEARQTWDTRRYSELAPSECESFYKELQSLWTGRDEVLRYCSTAAEAHLKQEQGRSSSLSSSSSSSGALDRIGLQDGGLNGDPQARDRLYAEEVKVG